MPHFVRNDVFQRFFHNAVGHLRCTCGGVQLRRLHQPPIVYGVHHVVVNQHRGIDYLARSWVGPRWSHSVFNVSRQIPDAGIGEIVGVEVVIVGGKVGYLHHILKPNAFESLVPPQYTRLNSPFPKRWKGVFHIKHDGLNGFGGRSCEISRRVFGFYTPTFNKRGLVYRAIAGQHILVNEKHSHACIAQTRRHLLVGQQGKGEVNADGYGVVGNGRAALSRQANQVMAVHLDAGVAFEHLERGYSRQVFL